MTTTFTTTATSTYRLTPSEIAWARTWDALHESEIGYALDEHIAARDAHREVMAGDALHRLLAEGHACQVARIEAHFALLESPDDVSLQADLRYWERQVDLHWERIDREWAARASSA